MRFADMNRVYIFITATVLLLLVTLTLMNGCFFGDDSDSAGYWIYFEEIEPESGTTVETDSVIITGQTSYPERPPTSDWAGECPYIDCPESTVMQVSWLNMTTGVSGSADQEIRNSCWTFFGWCRCECVHEFTAAVPLALGDNDIKITAIDGAGSSESFTMSVNYQPAPPDNITAVANHGQVTISWDPVPGATSYDLYWSTSRDMTIDAADRIIGVSSPYVLYGLTDYTPYYFLMKTYINNFESRTSDLVWAVPGWLTEIVYDSNLYTNEAAIETDSMNNPHIHASYGVSSISHKNIYLSKNVGSWAQLYTVETGRTNADLALDSNNNPNLTYIKDTGLIRAVYTTGAWSESIIDSPEIYRSHIVIDDNDDIHLAYKRYQDEASSVMELRYATNVTGVWETWTVYSLADAFSEDIDITADKTGTAYIAYAGDRYNNGVRYFEIQERTWNTVPVDSEPSAEVAIAVDQNSDIHIIYTLQTGQLKYATNELGVWITEHMQDVTDSLAPSIAVGSDGRVHVVYLDNTRHEFRYAVRSSGLWQYYTFEISDSEITSYGGNTAITIDNNQKVHISFYGYDGLLKYTTNR